jgi:hypothetical protein
MGYDFSSAGHAAAEIGVRLIAYGRHEELGLTRLEAQQLGAQYVDTLNRQYGQHKAKDIADRVFDALGSTDSRGESEPGGVDRRVTNARESGPPSRDGTNTPDAAQEVRGTELAGKLGPPAGSSDSIDRPGRPGNGRRAGREDQLRELQREPADKAVDVKHADITAIPKLKRLPGVEYPGCLPFDDNLFLSGKQSFEFGDAGESGAVVSRRGKTPCCTKDEGRPFEAAL